MGMGRWGWMEFFELNLRVTLERNMVKNTHSVEMQMTTPQFSSKVQDFSHLSTKSFECLGNCIHESLWQTLFQVIQHFFIVT